MAATACGQKVRFLGVTNPPLPWPTRRSDEVTVLTGWDCGAQVGGEHYRRVGSSRIVGVPSGHRRCPRDGRHVLVVHDVALPWFLLLVVSKMPGSVNWAKNICSFRKRLTLIGTWKVPTFGRARRSPSPCWHIIGWPRWTERPVAVRRWTVPSGFAIGPRAACPAPGKGRW